MTRNPRFYLSGVPVHVVQRGNCRQAAFFEDNDYHSYMSWLAEGAQKHGCQVHAYVLMTNHVHLLLTPSSETSVSRLMQCLGRPYVRYFNYTYQRSGALWEGRVKACVEDADNYLLQCQQYIELNPVRAGMVETPGEYRWSSYRPMAWVNRSNCGHRTLSTRC